MRKHPTAPTGAHIAADTVVADAVVADAVVDDAVVDDRERCHLVPLQRIRCDGSKPVSPSAVGAWRPRPSIRLKSHAAEHVHEPANVENFNALSHDLTHM